MINPPFVSNERGQARWFGIREWTDQKSIHHAEDRGIRANSQPQSQKHGKSKTRIAAQLPESISGVTKSGFNRGLLPDFVTVFFDERNVSNFTPGDDCGLFA